MSAARPGDGRSLLLVEDHEGLRTRLTVALRRRGFEVTAVGTAADALALAESPELALVDLKLPDADGISVVRQLHERDPRTNIVVLSGYGSIPTALDAVRRGATWFLSKPADADEVLLAFARGDESLREALGLGRRRGRASVPRALAGPHGVGAHPARARRLRRQHHARRRRARHSPEIAPAKAVSPALRPIAPRRIATVTDLRRRHNGLAHADPARHARLHVSLTGGGRGRDRRRLVVAEPRTDGL